MTDPTKGAGEPTGEGEGAQKPVETEKPADKVRALAEKAKAEVEARKRARYEEVAKRIEAINAELRSKNEDARLVREAIAAIEDTKRAVPRDVFEGPEYAELREYGQGLVEQEPELLIHIRGLQDEYKTIEADPAYKEIFALEQEKTRQEKEKQEKESQAEQRKKFLEQVDALTAHFIKVIDEFNANTPSPKVKQAEQAAIAAQGESNKIRRAFLEALNAIYRQLPSEQRRGGGPGIDTHFRQWFEWFNETFKPSWFPLADKPLRKLRAMSEDPRIQELEKKEEEVKRLQEAIEAARAELRKYIQDMTEKAGTLPEGVDMVTSAITKYYGDQPYFKNPDDCREAIKKMRTLEGVMKNLFDLLHPSSNTESGQSVIGMNDNVKRYIENLQKVGKRSY